MTDGVPSRKRSKIKKKEELFMVARCNIQHKKVRKHNRFLDKLHGSANENQPSTCRTETVFNNNLLAIGMIYLSLSAGDRQIQSIACN